MATPQSDFGGEEFFRAKPDRAIQLLSFLDKHFERCQDDPMFYRIRIPRKELRDKLSELGLTWRGGW